jgi:Protein of unknown function (DUF3800)
MLERRIGRLRAWLAGMAEQLRAQRRWAIVQAYIDDSGERSHAPVLVLAGFIAPFPQWEKFIPDWQRMLDMPCRIEYFKMSEARCAPAKPKGQFDGWSRERTDERVAIAYSVIEDHAHFQVSCIVDLEPFYRLFERSFFERNAINPFYLAFGRMITGFAHKQRDLGLHEKVDFIFDERMKEKKKIRDAWDAYKESAEPEIKPYIGSDPRFESDLEFLPLQAADFNAWWIRKMATEKRQIAAFPWKGGVRYRVPNFTTMKKPN